MPLPRRHLLGLAITLPAALAAMSAASAAPATTGRVTVNGIDIFYRAAGPVDAPVVLLLHGFPSSSHMFRDLIPLLSEHYRVIAPDYPGFGYSATPDAAQFPYTFAALTDLVDGFTQAMGMDRYALYMQDYGGPVGFRLATAHPERVSAMIVQNAVVNVEGWNPDIVAQLAPFWADRNAETEKPLRTMLAPETTEFQYRQGSTRAERLTPDAWRHDQIALDAPGGTERQLSYFYDYQTNVGEYPRWQEYLSTAKPPLLVVWGQNDPFFTTAGADLFGKLVPDAETHLFDAGHFALETHVDEIAPLIVDFLDRKL